MTDTPEYRFWLAGAQRTGTPYTVACPYDGQPVGSVHRAGPDDLEQATQAAVRAFETTRKLPVHKRAAVLRKVAIASGRVAGLVQAKLGRGPS